MAFVPHFYPNCQFSPEELSDITSVMTQQENYGTDITFASSNCSNGEISTISACAMLGHEQINLPLLCHNDGSGLEKFQMAEPGISSRVPVTTTASPFCGSHGVSDMSVPSTMNYKMSCSDIDIAKVQNFGGGFQFLEACEYGEDRWGFVQNMKSVSPETGQNWGIQCNQMPEIHGHANIKVGRYTADERKDRILRYLKKRNRRNFNQTVKYACRKTLADRRVRVRGRFARNNEPREEETRRKMIDNPLQEKESFCNDTLEMKKDDDADDDWVQEAVESLIYVPYGMEG